MSIQISDLPELSNAVELRVTGKINVDDYRKELLALEQRIAELGELRLLAVMANFQGIDFAAIWEELKFDVRHYGDFERVAVVGDRGWQHWMTAVCEPISPAPIKYFDIEQYASAKEWLLADDVSTQIEGAANLATPYLP